MAEIGADFRVEVEDYTSVADPKPFVPVEDMTSFDRNKSRTTSTQAVFHSAIPRRTRGARDTTFTLGGLLNVADPGQNLLRQAENDDVAVNLRVLPDGVNGFTQVGEINTLTHRATPDGFQETTFEFGATEAAVDVGDGTNL